MKRPLLFFLLTLVIVFVLSLVWEFVIEPNLFFRLPTTGNQESNAERWEYIFTVSSFCFLALIFPTLLFIRLERQIKRADILKTSLINELHQALDEIKILRGIIPICANCKQIRDDKGLWNEIETYIQNHSEAQFSHGICPKCAKELYPEFDEFKSLDKMGTKGKN